MNEATAMGFAQKYRADLRKKLVELGIFGFSEYFLAAFYDELPNSELTAEKINAAINYLASDM